MLLNRSVAHLLRTRSICSTFHPPSTKLLPCQSTFSPIRYLSTKLAGDLKRGDIIERRGKKLQVMKAQHVSSGRGSAYMQADLSDLLKGGKFKERFRVDEKLDLSETEFEEHVYVGTNDEGKHVFQRKSDFEELELDAAFLGEINVAYLEEDMEVKIFQVDGKVAPFLIASKAEVEVESIEGKGRVKLVNGRIVKGNPPHIRPGDTITVSLPEEEFMNKVAD